MKEKLIHMLLMALLIITVIFPAVSTEIEPKEEQNDMTWYAEEYGYQSDWQTASTLDQLDQQSNKKDGAEPIGGSMPKDGLAQSFKPTLSTLTKVKLWLKATSTPEYVYYYVYIKQTLTGSVLTSASILSSSIIVGTGLYTFDFPDITVTPGATYYIVVRGVTSQTGSPVYWWYGYPNPYTNGYAFDENIDGSWSLFHPSGHDVDFCFETYGIPSGPNSPPNTPTPLSGPSSGTTGSTLSYTTSTTDPDNDYIYYGLEEDGDSTSDWWSSSPYPSGALITVYITFGSAGTYYIRVQAKDIHGALSGFSSTKIITIGSGGNNAPHVPSAPSGPTTGTVGVSYSYSTSTTDDDGDQVKYGFDWDGDDIIDEWSGLQASGTLCSLSHSWSADGTYQIKVMAEDEYGAGSGWSPTLMVTISAANNPPEKPSIPSGQTKGKPGTSYTYSCSTTDGDGDNVYYWFDWGDGTNSGWIGPFTQGTSISEAHIWAVEGTYPVKVKAKDIHDEESVWSDPLSVSMPKPRSYVLVIQRFLNIYPLVSQILQHYLDAF
jgi:hypothetical protein